MIFIYAFLFLALTYFISSIPFGLILTKSIAHTDIRQSGSGNIGATNVARIAGKKLGLITLILDALKGALMVIIARFEFYSMGNLHLFLVLVSLVAVLGHIFPLYLDFKGGKGVATTIAVLLTLDPSVGFLMIMFWIMTFVTLRISSIASLVAIASSVALSIHYEAPHSQIALCIFLFILIAIRHKENIIRLLLGEEKKI